MEASILDLHPQTDCIAFATYPSSTTCLFYENASQNLRSNMRTTRLSRILRRGGLLVRDVGRPGRDERSGRERQHHGVVEPVPRQAAQGLLAVAQRCVKKGSTIGEEEMVEVLSAS